MRLFRPRYGLTPLDDGALLRRTRNGRVEDTLRLGPNQVHAVVIHADGSITDCGVSQNFLCTDGRDLVAASLGHPAGWTGAPNPITATALTSSGWTADQYKGWRVYSPVTGVTTAPVYGNIGSNTTTVITIDQWWTAADGTGTTPANSNAVVVYACCVPRFMGITEATGAGAAADTTLASEITTGGCNRQLATYAHTNDASTFTLIKSFSVSASFPAVHRMGLFTASNVTAGGVLVFETVLNADANVISGDTLQITETVTLSG